MRDGGCANEHDTASLEPITEDILVFLLPASCLLRIFFLGGFLIPDQRRAEF